jgi:hypothetical protein
MNPRKSLVTRAGMLCFALVGIAIAGMPTSLLTAAEPASYDGTIVSVSDGKLTMIETGETEQDVYDVSPTAKITLDGKTAKLADLKKGMKVTVTVTDDDDEIIVAIRAVTS